MEYYEISNRVTKQCNIALAQITKEMSELLAGKELFKLYKTKEHLIGVIDKVSATSFTDGYECYLMVYFTDGSVKRIHSSYIHVGQITYGYYLKNN